MNDYKRGFNDRVKYQNEIDEAKNWRPWGMLLSLLSVMFGILPGLMLGITYYLIGDKNINQDAVPIIKAMFIPGIIGVIWGFRITSKQFAKYQEKLDAINDKWNARLENGGLNA